MQENMQINIQNKICTICNLICTLCEIIWESVFSKPDAVYANFAKYGIENPICRICTPTLLMPQCVLPWWTLAKIHVRTLGARALTRGIGRRHGRRGAKSEKYGMPSFDMHSGAFLNSKPFYIGQPVSANCEIHYNFYRPSSPNAGRRFGRTCILQHGRKI